MHPSAWPLKAESRISCTASACLIWPTQGSRIASGPPHEVVLPLQNAPKIFNVATQAQPGTDLIVMDAPWLSLIFFHWPKYALWLAIEGILVGVIVEYNKAGEPFLQSYILTSSANRLLFNMQASIVTTLN